MFAQAVIDTLGRPLRTLRISVTDRCNLRCTYCMPEASYRWLPRADLLDFEEIAQVAGVFADLGVHRIRLTGGEPLLRRQLHELVGLLRAIPGIDDIALTTNGVLLAEQAGALRDAGLHRLTVSIDTLRSDRYRRLTGRDTHAAPLHGLIAARDAGFTDIKLNVVVMRGVNDDELADILAFGQQHQLEVRFIEYMDVGGATEWEADRVVPRSEMLESLGALREIERPRASTPARSYVLRDGTRFGVIASMTQPFCGDCDRGRLTADGMFYLCLYGSVGVDLRQPLRDGTTTAALSEIVATAWRGRRDRGAEERGALSDRGTLVQIAELKRDPHLEMHTRGG